MVTVANTHDTRPHTVLRAICMAGQRVEAGAVVQLTRTQAQELAAAGKVSAQPVEVLAVGPADVPADPAPAKARAKRAGG